jgi:hypothetical protein
VRAKHIQPLFSCQWMNGCKTLLGTQFSEAAATPTIVAIRCAGLQMLLLPLDPRRPSRNDSDSVELPERPGIRIWSVRRGEVEFWVRLKWNHHSMIGKEWRGRRDSNPRPLP